MRGEPGPSETCFRFSYCGMNSTGFSRAIRSGDGAGHAVNTFLVLLIIANVVAVLLDDAVAVGPQWQPWLQLFADVSIVLAGT